MDPIFARAESVITWPANVTISSEVVLGLSKFNDQAATSYEVYFRDQVQEGELLYESIMSHLRTAVQVHHSDVAQDGNWLELLKRDFWSIPSRPWFLRLWILQEATLPQDLFLRAGHQQVSRPRLFGLFEGLKGY
jgi:hypothetical protein